MKNQTTRTMALVRMALLVAVELIMAVTPLGYLRTAGLEISFLMVPVALGGILLGPLAGAVLGGVFGVSSFLAAFSSAFGAPLLALNPFYTFVVCFVPRVLAGWLPGLLVRAMTKEPQKSKLPAFAAASLAAAFAAAAAAGWWTSAAALATLALVWAGGECAARLAGGTAFSAPGGLTAWRRLFGHY